MRDPNEIAADLQVAFASMPDAGLTVDEPRYKWWNVRLREAVAEAAQALRREIPTEQDCPRCGRGCIACFNAGRSHQVPPDDLARRAEDDRAALIFFILGLDTVPVEMWENLPAHLREEIENG